jgi:uncharacterized peroxidase-related enzyme
MSEAGADQSFSRFPVPDPSALPDDLRQLIESTAARAGFTPNVFLAYAWRPEHFRAFFQYYDVLMKGASGLSRAERELVALAVSVENQCLY